MYITIVTITCFIIVQDKKIVSTVRLYNKHVSWYDLFLFFMITLILFTRDVIAELCQQWYEVNNTLQVHNKCTSTCW